MQEVVKENTDRKNEKIIEIYNQKIKKRVLKNKKQIQQTLKK